MFAGLLRDDAHDVTEPIWRLLSLILAGTGQALDNAALYRRLVGHTRELEQAVETRTQDLKTSAAENRRLYRRARRAYRELSRTKDQLVQAQKIEAIGQLAGGVAHDFNNLLTVISGSSELLLANVSESDPRRRHVDVIRQTAARAAALTRQLLAFSRRQILKPRLLSLGDVIVNIEQMLRRLLGEDIELHTRCDPGTGHVSADPGQLDQVVMNLAVNARDAMPDGGRLLIETSNADLDEDFVRAHPGAHPGRYVRLQVADTGVGMDATVRAHLFEPFFTTKELGRGTGLGLATVYGIVKQSGGFIWVDSAPGYGARFTIDLPRVEAPTAAVEGAGASSRLPQGTETILVVEDEEAVRCLAREVLAGCGYAILEASHGEEALRVAAEHAGPIDLVVTDVVMPRMNGRELVDRLIPIRPGVKVVYMSGYTDDSVVARGVATAGLTFLQKPFTLAVLARTVREVLDV
jgi:signal transduction histidine kinase